MELEKEMGNKSSGNAKESSRGCKSGHMGEARSYNNF